MEAATSGKMNITIDQLKTIFGNVEDIYNVNQTLLKSLYDKIGEWSDTQKIGDVLEMIAPFLRLYTLYSINFETANELVKELVEKKDSFKMFLEEVQEKPECMGLSFQAYLIMPIQRIPRYRMLITDLVKNTPNTHEDYVKLEKSLESFIEVAGKVDAAVTEAEKREEMLKVAKKFDGYKEVELIKPGRSFIMDGELQKVCRKEVKKRAFFLFSDLLLYAGNTKYVASKQYKIAKKRMFFLSNLTVVDIEDDASKGLINAFQIQTEVKSFNVMAMKEEEKKKWIKSINDCIQEIKSKALSFPAQMEKKEFAAAPTAPVWVPDAEVKSCAVCDTKFTFTNRRHHCRDCGLIVCGTCSQNKKFIPKQGEQRICDNCYFGTGNPTAVVANNPTRTHTREEAISGSAGVGEASYAGSEGTESEILYMLEALFDYDPKQIPGTPPKLPFKQGDIISILQTDSSGWWFGEKSDEKTGENTGERGWVPSSFLEEPPRTT
eukprot:TRINITY_DN6704_c0_g1_i9.p1 TRINITY_DN6704_c0_g1~~TRINITY_DN6704_c0_g1_i9.p1  ORF type:complete len:492 (-),score=147.03 TRINITY_DN6704_c0_g1_i9:199-1674(-)